MKAPNWPIVTPAYASQALTFLIAVLDRIVIAGLLIRLWGVAVFEDWTLIASVAALTYAFELGFSIYFNNKMALTLSRSNRDEALQVYRAGNLIFIGIFLLILATIAVLAGTGIWVSLFPFSAIAPSEGMWSAAALSTAAAFRLGVFGILALYRAHDEITRFNLVFAGGEAVRLLMTGLAAYMGFSFVAVASCSALGTVATQAALALDSSCRYPGFGTQIGWPKRQLAGEMLRISVAYCLQSAPVTILASAPNLLIGIAQSGSGDLAAFALTRTLVNFLRTLFQNIAVVTGYDCARHYAAGSVDQLWMTFRRHTRVYSVVSGCACGGIVVFSQQVFQYWTGRNDLFRPGLMAIVAAPLLFGGPSTIVGALIMSVNRPGCATIGRLAQLLITFALFALAPIPDAALSISVALSVAEMAYIIPLYIGAASLVPKAGLVFYLVELLAALGAFTVASLAGFAAVWLFPISSELSFSLDLAITAIVCTAVIGWTVLE